jgi:flagellar basal body L-ring protein FlgH
LSSKKRKATWSEEDGEVTISPGGTKRTKRTKRAQSNGVAVSEVTKQEENVDGEGETEISEQIQAEITVVLDDVEKVEVEDDAKSYDSLFHGSSSQEDQDHA